MHRIIRLSLYGILNYRTGSNHQTQYSKIAYERHDHLTILFSIYEELWYPASNEIVAGRGTPLQGPKSGSCVTLRNALSEETRADKARDFTGKGHPGGEQEGKGTQENCSATWLAVLGFMVMGLVSRWSLANHSNSESFLVAQSSLSQDGC